MASSASVKMLLILTAGQSAGHLDTAAKGGDHVEPRPGPGEIGFPNSRAKSRSRPAAQDRQTPGQRRDPSRRKTLPRSTAAAPHGMAAKYLMRKVAGRSAWHYVCRLGVGIGLARR